MVGAVTPHRHHGLSLQAPSHPEGKGAQGVAGEVAAAACVRLRSVSLNYCDRLRSLSIVYERFALCKDNCTQRVRGVLGAAQGGGAGGVKASVSCLFCSILCRTASVAAWMSASAAGASLACTASRPARWATP